MQKKKLLKLNIETVKVLTDREKSDVAGGVDGPYPRSLNMEQ